ncbi:MAG: nitrogenase [Agathobacter sp.]|nr:nitrogenase [Agathobacter sp.]
MLKQIGTYGENRKDEIKIKNAEFPAIFHAGLEFNAPVHGTWNIVHIGMQLPESIQIYVCAQNCMRGVVLTAAEMNAADRFSYVVLSERDMIAGDVEEITIRGVIDVLQKRQQLPRAVLLFTVCVHHFLGCDYNRIYRELEQKFPQIDFVRCYMDPIMQKQGLTPDQKLRRAILEKLPQYSSIERKLAILGSDFAYDTESGLFGLLRQEGCEIVQSRTCSTYDEFLQMAQAEVFVCVYPPAKIGTEQTAKRLGRTFFYLPASFDYALIERQAEILGNYFAVTTKELKNERRLAEEALDKAFSVIGTTPIAIDYTVHPRPLGLARLLLSHGFFVDTIYIDTVSKEEEADFIWLKEHVPELKLSATIQVSKRIAVRGRNKKVLAIGQKAAWFEDTPWFVNMVSGGNLYGYSGICEMTNLMTDAFLNPKDTKDIVPRKGWGCDSCL